LGTFDELFEILTWAQLGLHAEPIGLLNLAGYFKPLLNPVASAVREGFIAQNPPFLASEGADVGMLLDQLLQGRQAGPGAPHG
jgi:predicted Rossmann-fold nucleotide-binding protein